MESSLCPSGPAGAGPADRQRTRAPGRSLCEQLREPALLSSSSTTATLQPLLWGSSWLHWPGRLALRFLPGDFHPPRVQNAASAMEQETRSWLDLEVPVTANSGQLRGRRGACASCCHPPVSSRDCDRHSGCRMCLLLQLSLPIHGITAFLGLTGVKGLCPGPVHLCAGV